MSQAATYVIEATITAILAFWIITHSTQFNAITSAAGTAAVGSVRRLSGN